ncbi:uncharacterized protein LOC130633755 isoform X2 [Hydractinia symbiolongicarpus]|nr:uncharacterized protein LOC130633755 isoform X2 [Hydractinia symbiolongicarpus]
MEKANWQIRGGLKYKAIPYPMTWTYSRVICGAMGADLSVIRSPCENNFINSLLKFQEAWIGLHRSVINNHTLKQVDGERSRNFSNYLSTVDQTQRDNKTNYISYMGANGKWLEEKINSDNANLIKKPFVCQNVAELFLELPGASWSASNRICSNRGMQLLTIKSKEKAKYIEEMYAPKTFWLGLQYSLNAENYQWLDGTDLSSTYSGLKEIKIKQCVQLKNSDKWEESKCDAIADVNLCEFTPDPWKDDPSNTGGNCELVMSHRCFMKINSSMSWDNAKSTCQKRDSHLASILSEEENNAIYVMYGRTDYWLGGIYSSKHSEYIWVDGNDFIYKNYHTEAFTECVYMHKDKWETGDCLRLMPFLCVKSLRDAGSGAIEASKEILDAEAAARISSPKSRMPDAEAAARISSSKPRMPDNWQRYNQIEYLMTGSLFSFKEASSTCLSKGGVLLNETFPYYVIKNSEIWIDLKYNGSVWLLGSKNASFFEVAEQFPDPPISNCSSITRCGKKQVPCDTKLKVLCQRPIPTTTTTESTTTTTTKESTTSYESTTTKELTTTKESTTSNESTTTKELTTTRKPITTPITTESTTTSSATTFFFSTNNSMLATNAEGSTAPTSSFFPLPRGTSFSNQYISMVKDNISYHCGVKAYAKMEPISWEYVNLPRFSYSNITGHLLMNTEAGEKLCLTLSGVYDWKNENKIWNVISLGSEIVTGSASTGSECMVLNYSFATFNVELGTENMRMCFVFDNKKLKLGKNCLYSLHLSSNPPAHWSRWSDWQPCDVLCGNGTQTRFRHCINEAQGSCVGKKDAIKTCKGSGDCSEHYIPSTGKSCTESCLLIGKRCDHFLVTGESTVLFESFGYHCSKNVSQRTWQNMYAPFYDLDTKQCVGYQKMPKEMDCDAVPPSKRYLRLCKCIGSDSVDTTTWLPWSECSQSCNGVRSRKRFCALTSENHCASNRFETESCNTDVLCPVHGGFTQWTQWSNCYASCGLGHRVRNRSCTHPSPKDGGFTCAGAYTEQQSCAARKCPINGEWGSWSSYSGCTKPCNSGVRVKRRYCTSPAPMYGGKPCQGAWNHTVPCNQSPCPATYINVTCKFDLKYTPALGDKQGSQWRDFENAILSETKFMYEDTFGDVVSSIKLSDVRRGSILASFSINFHQFDSYQLVYLQDSLQNEKAIGKLPIVDGSPSSILTDSVPTGPPSNIHVVSTYPTSFNVSWSEVDITLQNGNIQGYLLFYREKFKPSDPYEVYGSVLYWAEITGLKPGTVYVIRLLAFTAAGNGVASNLMGVKTLEAAPSAPPTSLTGFAIDATSIYVQWSGVDMDDMNGDPLGYNVYFNDGYNTNKAISPFSPPHIILNGLHPVTTYVIDVCAFNAVGEGPCEATGVTSKLSAPRIPPGNLFVYFKLHDSLAVKWDHISSEVIDAYRIQYYMIERGRVAVEKPDIKEVTLVPSFQTYNLKFLSPNSKYVIKVYGVNGAGDGVPSLVIAETCKCPATVHSNFYVNPPYTQRSDKNHLDGVFYNILPDMIKAACGKCNHRMSKETVVDFIYNGKFGFSFKPNGDRVTEDVDEFTDLSFPLSVNPAKNDSLNSKYVPLLSYPGAVFIIKNLDASSHVKKMIGDVLATWPIFMLNFFFTLISGALVWFLEIYFIQKPEATFSPSLKNLIGLRQGWYWAYITQTTLGYGDFVPIGKASRCFAVIWIFTSLVMSSLLLGALTTAFTAVQTTKTKSMYGVKVAALSGSFEERLAILKNGQIDKEKTYTSVSELTQALHNDHVFGILIDAYTAGSNRDILDDPLLHVANLIKYPRSFGVVLSGGLANVDQEVLDYVKTNEGNILEVLEMFTQKLKPQTAAKEVSLFDAESTVLRTGITVLSVLLCLTLLLGFVASQLCKKKSRIKVKPVERATKEADEEEAICDLQCCIKTFYEQFHKNINTLSSRIDAERVKLYFDRGSSSLRIQPRQCRTALRHPKSSARGDRASEDGSDIVAEHPESFARSDTCSGEPDSIPDVESDVDTTTLSD